MATIGSYNSREDILNEDRNLIFEKTMDLWEPFRNQNIFITGGTGFFGCLLLDSLFYVDQKLSLGCTVTVLTRNPQAFRQRAPELAYDRRLNLIQGDVCDFEFPDEKFYAVIHAATDIVAASQNPIEVLDSITVGTRRVMDFSGECGAKIVLLTSSGAVYGSHSPHQNLLSEDSLYGPDPLNIKSAYGEGKRLSEFIGHVYSQKFSFDLKIARCFACLGPYMSFDSHFAIGNFIKNIESSENIVINGDGTPMRSYLYAADLMTWLWTILFRGVSSRAYNVGSEDGLSIYSVAEMTREALNASNSIIVSREPDLSKMPERYLPSTARARKELGLQQYTSFENAIQKTAFWYRNEKKGN
jgi:nucleoside-diphosphate-sugar epimerase